MDCVPLATTQSTFSIGSLHIGLPEKSNREKRRHMTDTSDSSSDVSNHEGYVIEAENAAEMARLMLQDQMLTNIMGGPLAEQTDLSRVYHILDIACGPGGWLLELVKRHPHIQPEQKLIKAMSRTCSSSISSFNLFLYRCKYLQKRSFSTCTSRWKRKCSKMISAPSISFSQFGDIKAINSLNF
jgi:hypothetical protein